MSQILTNFSRFFRAVIPDRIVLPFCSINVKVKQKASETRCISCRGKGTPLNPVNNGLCKHSSSVCGACISAHIDQHIRNDNGNQPALCPAPNCGAPVTAKSLQSVPAVSTDQIYNYCQHLEGKRRCSSCMVVYRKTFFPQFSKTCSHNPSECAVCLQRRMPTAYPYQMKNPPICSHKCCTSTANFVAYRKVQLEAKRQRQRTWYKTVKCRICLDEVALTDSTSATPNCHHIPASCTRCLRRYLEHEISEKSVNIECLETGCCNTISPDDVERISGDTELSSTYENRMFLHEISSMEEFVWCANDKCDHGQLHFSSKPRMKCTHCDRHTCAFHRMEWHEGLTCTQYDRSKAKENLSRYLASGRVKQCPKCSHGVEKNGGCDRVSSCSPSLTNEPLIDTMYYTRVTN